MTSEHFDEPDLEDFADRPLPPRLSRTSRLVIVAAIAAVIGMVATGLVVGGATPAEPPSGHRSPVSSDVARQSDTGDDQSI